MTKLTDEEKKGYKADFKERAKLDSHVLMKVRSEDGRTVVEHQKVIASLGETLLGKMGAPIGRKLVAGLQSQIGSGVPTYLYLAVRQGWKGGFKIYKSRLGSVEYDLPSDSDHLIPKYYSHESARIATWLRITSLDLVPHSEAQKVVVISSGREVLSVLSSSASVFKVGTKK